MKKAMIYGLGISGTGAKELLEKEGYEIIIVDDKKAMTSEEALNHLDGIEFFIKSPGIPYNNFVKEVQKRGIKILDEIEIAYNYMIEKGMKTKIIAITAAYESCIEISKSEYGFSTIITINDTRRDFLLSSCSNKILAKIIYLV